ncbi:MAG: tetratricopeptide repeat protein, partial [Candidatus Caenarcaniphilales bacterium]|nr:tetratricopeptide repeat protein [Candidatus Caenarcaniphilales bacterium]
MKIGKLLKVALNTKKNLEKIIFFSFSEVHKKWQRKVLNKVLNITLVFVLSAIAAISQPLVVDAFNNSLQQVNLTNLKSNSKLNLSENPSGLFDQGKALYESGQLREAVEIWKQVASIYQQQNQLLALSTTLNNLSLAYQGLGEWQLAEKSISQSLQVARSLTPVTKESQREIARALDTSGNLSISTGKTEKALDFWKEAEILYDQTGDEVGKIRNILNQEQAFKNQGFYRRSRQILEDLLPKLQSQPDSLLKAIGFSRYGEILKL